MSITDTDLAPKAIVGGFRITSGMPRISSQEDCGPTAGVGVSIVAQPTQRATPTKTVQRNVEITGTVIGNTDSLANGVPVDGVTHNQGLEDFGP